MSDWFGGFGGFGDGGLSDWSGSLFNQPPDDMFLGATGADTGTGTGSAAVNDAANAYPDAAGMFAKLPAAPTSDTKAGDFDAGGTSWADWGKKLTTGLAALQKTASPLLQQPTPPAVAYGRAPDSPAHSPAELMQLLQMLKARQAAIGGFQPGGGGGGARGTGGLLGV